MAKSIRDFEGLYGRGELGRRASPGLHPDGIPHSGPVTPSLAEGAPADGFQSQTVNGTARATGTGWNGSFWEWEEPQLPPHGAWQPGRSNRSGE